MQTDKDLRIAPIDGGAFEVAEHKVLGLFYTRAHAELFVRSLGSAGDTAVPGAPEEETQPEPAAEVPEPAAAGLSRPLAPAPVRPAPRGREDACDPGAVRRKALAWSAEDDMTARAAYDVPRPSPLAACRSAP
ncbi:hypothetical protein [Profundibacterium mesophilum]|uniref:Uncharacterized protein n=1 Tax=Profundibacterium mesophilum KAUST100406-0324 TaxID=1037889 RepID=A0A921NTI0_9RHOB|nr:hypothetical protein [Profundibacterium mesophilum]KAF0674454.1 hypothetical protein PMES_03237 [Profundibacterium mesophilum KAUST100406-0324]